MRVLISALIQGAGGRFEEYDFKGACASKIWCRFVLIVDIFSEISTVKKDYQVHAARNLGSCLD